MLYNYAANPSAGCKNCANVAPGVFAIEEDFGRARAYNQSGNPELVQQAIDSWHVYVYHSTFFLSSVYHSTYLYLTVISTTIVNLIIIEVK